MHYLNVRPEKMLKILGISCKFEQVIHESSFLTLWRERLFVINVGLVLLLLLLLLKKEAFQVQIFQGEPRDRGRSSVKKARKVLILILILFISPVNEYTS